MTRISLDELNELLGPPTYDTRTGAPLDVRLGVSSAPTPLDALVFLQRHYGAENVTPWGAGNFLIPHPVTGEPMLYNEENPDFFGIPVPTIGDVVSAVPEMGEFAGGVAGAASMGLLAPETAGASLLAVPVAAGAGAAAGREGVARAVRGLLDVPDSRTIEQQAGDVATTFALNAGGQMAGDAALRGIGSAIAPIGRWRSGAGLPRTLDDASRLGVRLPAGAATGSPVVAAAERGLAAFPTGGGPFHRALAETHEGLQEAFERVGQDIATAGGANPAGRVPRGPQSIGQTAQQAMGARVAPHSPTAGGAVGRFTATQAGMSDDVLRLVGAETIADTSSLTGLRDRMLQQIVDAGGEIDGTDVISYGNRGDLRGAYQAVSGVLDSGARSPRGGMSFAELRGQRTGLGEDLAAADVTGYAGRQGAGGRELYGAMSDDLISTAGNVSREAQNALLLHDDFVRHWREVEFPVISRVVDAATPEQAYRILRQNIAEGGSMLQAVRRNATPEEWDSVASGMWQILGRATPGRAAGEELGQELGEFSFDTFVTNWNRLSPEAKNALFGGSRYSGVVDDMNRLVRVATALKEGGRFENFSNTGRATGMQMSILGSLGLGIGVDAASGGALFAGSVVAPNMASRLLQSPRFVQWLASPPTQGNAAAHIGRLVAIVEAEPELRDAMSDYLTAVGSMTEAQMQGLAELQATSSQHGQQGEQRFGEFLDSIGYRQEFEEWSQGRGSR